MMLSGVLMLSGNEKLTLFQCNGPYSIWSIGFTLFFVSYALRVWKVVMLIENGLLFRRQPITKKHVFLRLSIFVLIDIILIIIASTATPFEVDELLTFNEEMDEDQIPVFIELTTTNCTFSEDNMSAMWIIVFIYKFFILLWVITIAMRKQVLSDKVRKLKFMKFEEGSNIAIGIYMVIVSFLIFGLIAFSLATSSTVFSADLQWIICSFLSFLCYVTIICCVILHRVIYVVKKKKLKVVTSDVVAGSSQGGSTTKGMSSQSPSEDFEDEELTALDPLLQQAEFHANELFEVVSNPRFHQSAARTLADVVRNILEKVNLKEMSMTKPSEVNPTVTELTEQ